MYYFIISRAIIVLHFPASFVFKSTYDIVTQLLLTFVILCVGFAGFGAGMINIICFMSST